MFKRLQSPTNQVEFLVHCSLGWTKTQIDAAVVKLVLNPNETLAVYEKELTKLAVRLGDKTQVQPLSLVGSREAVDLQKPVGTWAGKMTKLCMGRKKEFFEWPPMSISTKLMSGEILFAPIPNTIFVSLNGDMTELISGVLWVTNYRLLFFQNEGTKDVQKTTGNTDLGARPLVFSIPISSLVSISKAKTTVQSFEDLKKPNEGVKMEELKLLLPALQAYVSSFQQSSGSKIFGKVPKVTVCSVLTSNFGHFRFCWVPRGQGKDKETTNGWFILKGLVVQFLGNGGIQPFAWQNLERLTTNSTGKSWWYLYDAQKEFNRFFDLHQDQESYKILDISQISTTVCESYLPRRVIVPRKLTKDLAQLFFLSMKYKKSRFPTLSWYTKKNSCVLFRSERNISPEEEKKVYEQITKKGAAPFDIKALNDTSVELSFVKACKGIFGETSPSFNIWDTGSPTSHVTSFNAQLYQAVTKFFEFPKIEDIRSSFSMFLALFTGPALMDGVKLYKKTENLWLRHISFFLGITKVATEVLDKSTNTAFVIQNGNNSNSDAVVVSLLQIIMDPYFRTLKGFCTLIDKEWIQNSFLNHSPSIPPIFLQKDKDLSLHLASRHEPVFLLFLDCVRQLILQNSESFEFDHNLLLFIYDSVQDCRFGNFFGDSHKERETAGVFTQTPSLWTYVLTEENQKYFQCRQSISPEVLEFRSEREAMSLWTSLFLRHRPENRFLENGARAGVLEIIQDKDAKNLTWSLWGPLVSLDLDLDETSWNVLVSKLNRLLIGDVLFGEIPTCVAKMSELTELSITRTIITQIDTDMVSNVTSLEKLLLHQNQIAAIPQNFTALTNLQLLRLNNNKIEHFPERFALPKLRMLELQDNQVSELSCISDLTALRTLNLKNNQLFNFPDYSFQNLTNLKTLEISDNEITTLDKLCLPASLLVLSAAICSLPAGLFDMVTLRILDLEDNCIEYIPPEIGNLVSLTQLNLCGNCFSELPITIRSLVSLQDLNLSKNRRLTSLTYGIGQCVALKRLLIEDTEITSLPLSMVSLTHLEEIAISSPSSFIFPPPEVMSKAGSRQGVTKILDIMRKKLDDKRGVFRIRLLVLGQENVGKTTTIGVMAKKWVPAVQPGLSDDRRGRNFGAVRKGASEKPGPTHKRFNTSEQIASTDGIKISHFMFPFEDQAHAHPQEQEDDQQMVTVSVWDFGGQEVYYPTHQLFLSNRSIYLIVFNLIDPSSEARVDFWLQSIKARASRVNVIIAATHAEDPRAGTPEEITARLNDLKAKFKQILQVFQSLVVIPISPTFTSGYYGIDHLRSEIERVICKQRHITEMIQCNYFLFEEMILQHQEKASVPLISFSEIKVFAILSQLEENTDTQTTLATTKCTPAAPLTHRMTLTSSDLPPSQVMGRQRSESCVAPPNWPQDRKKGLTLTSALELLHDLGSILFFGKDAHLNGKVILDSQWLANLMASLFTTKHTWVNRGILHHSQLCHVWKDIKPSIHPFLLRLLESFDLIIQIPDSDTENMFRAMSYFPSFIIPNLDSKIVSSSAPALLAPSSRDSVSCGSGSVGGISSADPPLGSIEGIFYQSLGDATEPSFSMEDRNRFAKSREDPLDEVTEDKSENENDSPNYTEADNKEEGQDGNEDGEADEEEGQVSEKRSKERVNPKHMLRSLSFLERQTMAQSLQTTEEEEVAERAKSQNLEKENILNDNESPEKVIMFSEDTPEILKKRTKMLSRTTSLKDISFLRAKRGKENARSSPRLFRSPERQENRSSESLISEPATNTDSVSALPSPSPPALGRSKIPTSKRASVVISVCYEGNSQPIGNSEFDVPKLEEAFSQSDERAEASANVEEAMSSSESEYSSEEDTQKKKKKPTLKLKKSRFGGLSRSLSSVGSHGSSAGPRFLSVKLKKSNSSQEKRKTPPKRTSTESSDDTSPPIELDGEKPSESSIISSNAIHIETITSLASFASESEPDSASSAKPVEEKDAKAPAKNRKGSSSTALSFRRRDSFYFKSHNPYASKSKSRRSSAPKISSTTPSSTPVSSSSSASNTPPSPSIMVMPHISIHHNKRPKKKTDDTSSTDPQSLIPSQPSSPSSAPNNAEELTGVSIVPALLPPRIPRELYSWMTLMWPEFPQDVSPATLQLHRSFSFTFIPKGLFSRLIVRMLKLFKLVSLWGQGILVTTRDGQQTILVEHFLDEYISSHTTSSAPLQLSSRTSARFLTCAPAIESHSLSGKFTRSDVADKLRTNELSVQVRGENWTDVQQTFLLILEIVREICQFWAGLEWKRFTFSPQYVKECGSVPIMIPVEAMEEHFIATGSTDFVSEGEFIDMTMVVPDLVFSTYGGPRASYSEIKITKLLGHGGYGDVFLGDYNGEEVAIKKLNIGSESEQILTTQVSEVYREFRHEVSMQCELDHTSFIALKAICIKPFCIIMECALNGTLHEVLHDYSLHFSWDLRLKVALELAQGLYYMQEVHNPPIAHLDLKSPNVMMVSLDPNDPYCAKIADFGTMRFCRQNLPITGRFVDNPVWLAPEIFMNLEYTYTVDTYAFGVILWETITRRSYCGNLTFMSDIEDKILNGYRPIIPGVSRGCPTIFADIIENCWRSDASLRPSFTWVISELQKLTSMQDHEAKQVIYQKQLLAKEKRKKQKG